MWFHICPLVMIKTKLRAKRPQAVLLYKNSRLFRLMYSRPAVTVKRMNMATVPV